ncbi:MAG TPA: DNA-binding protein [Candidatus Nanoarchaeia archaeon]|nr:DNA-binding protein [Candidatus Nanoarchaeia archaeon]
MNEESQNEIEEKLKIQKQMLEIENMAKNFMTQEALVRFGNLKSAYPEKAFKTAAVIVQLANQGQISSPLSDLQLKELLIKLEPESRDFRIVRR